MNSFASTPIGLAIGSTAKNADRVRDVKALARLDIKILTLKSRIEKMPNCQGLTALSGELAALERRRALLSVGSSR